MNTENCFPGCFSLFPFIISYYDFPMLSTRQTFSWRKILLWDLPQSSSVTMSRSGLEVCYSHFRIFDLGSYLFSIFRKVRMEVSVQNVIVYCLYHKHLVSLTCWNTRRCSVNVDYLPATVLVPRAVLLGEGKDSWHDRAHILGAGGRKQR